MKLMQVWDWKERMITAPNSSVCALATHEWPESKGEKLLADFYNNTHNGTEQKYELIFTYKWSGQIEILNIF